MVGAGPGDPGLLTRRGAELLAFADVVVYDALVNQQLLQLAPKGAEIIYGGKRSRDHAIPQDQLNQLLVQKGILLNWEEELVCHAPTVLASPELPQDQPVFVGKSEKYVAVRTGLWTFQLAIEKDRRYPDVDHTIWSTSQASTTLELSPEDAKVLSEHLPELRGREDDTQPITLDLAQNIAIRAGDSTGEPLGAAPLRQLHSGQQEGRCHRVIAGGGKPAQ